MPSSLFVGRQPSLDKRVEPERGLPSAAIERPLPELGDRVAWVDTIKAEGTGPTGTKATWGLLHELSPARRHYFARWLERD